MYFRVALAFCTSLPLSELDVEHSLWITAQAGTNSVRHVVILHYTRMYTHTSWYLIDVIIIVPSIALSISGLVAVVVTPHVHGHHA